MAVLSVTESRPHVFMCHLLLEVNGARPAHRTSCWRWWRGRELVTGLQGDPVPRLGSGVRFWGHGLTVGIHLQALHVLGPQPWVIVGAPPIMSWIELLKHILCGKLKIFSHKFHLNSLHTCLFKLANNVLHLGSPHGLRWQTKNYCLYLHST